MTEMYVGGLYKTRSGHDAWVLEKDTRSSYPFRGVVKHEGGEYFTQTWTEQGRTWLGENPGTFDLIELKNIWESETK